MKVIHITCDTSSRLFLLTNGVSKGLLPVYDKGQGQKIGCLEELAFQKGLIPKQGLLEIAQTIPKTIYGQYLLKRYNTQ